MSREPRHCMVVHAYYPVGEDARPARSPRTHRSGLRGACRVPSECGRAQQGDARGRSDPPAACGASPRSGSSRTTRRISHVLRSAFAKLAVLHSRYRFRTVQVHNLPDFLVFCALVPRLGGTPIILDLHDLTPELYAARAGVGMDHWLVRAVAWQERVSCRFADHVITVTDGWRDRLVQRGMSRDDVSVVMNVADSRLFRPDPALAPARNGEGFHLIYHGTFTHRYGVDLIIDAVDRVREDIPGIQLTLLGAGENAARRSLRSHTAADWKGKFGSARTWSRPIDSRAPYRAQTLVSCQTEATCSPTESSRPN